MFLRPPSATSDGSPAPSAAVAGVAPQLTGMTSITGTAAVGAGAGVVETDDTTAEAAGVVAAGPEAAGVVAAGPEAAGVVAAGPEAAGTAVGMAVT